MLPAEFFPPFVSVCARLLCDPKHLLSVAANESGCNPAAWNEGGKAAGLWQLTPVAAPGVGWNPNDTRAFAQLTAVQQLPYWERYFRPHRGQLVSPAAAYVCTYLPAGMSIAGNPDALLCSKDGRTDIPPAPGSHAWSTAAVVSWYKGNLGFDAKRCGEIRVRDLNAAIDRATKALGDTWLAYEREIDSLVVVDVTDGGLDAPVYRFDPA